MRAGESFRVGSGFPPRHLHKLFKNFLFLLRTQLISCYCSINKASAAHPMRMNGWLLRDYSAISLGWQSQTVLFLYKPCIPEIQRDAPDGAGGYYYIDDSRYNGCRAAEQVGDKVKLEYSYKSPVDASHDKKKQGDSVQYLYITHSLILRASRCINIYRCMISFAHGVIFYSFFDKNAPRDMDKWV